MAKIEIEWMSDSMDCETCGGSWAEGAIVKMDGEIVLDFTPHAHCYDSTSFDQSQIYEALIQHLGHELVTTTQPYVEQTYVDDDYGDEEE